MKKLTNKKGSASTVLIVVLIVALVILGIYIRMNWRVFKAEASFGFTLGVLVVLAVVIIYLLIKHKIKKAGKEREARKLEKEQEALEKKEAALEQKQDKADSEQAVAGDKKDDK